MKLIWPTMEYAKTIQDFRREFLKTGDSMDGGASLRKFERTQDWLDHVESFRRAETTQFIYLRESDGKMVGVIQIRHRFNAYLEKFGGHIGYAVAPSERRKGYATQMLRAALPECVKLGIDRVLVTCLRETEASRRTILKNGGLYESTVYDPKENCYIERYWIDLSGHS